MNNILTEKEYQHYIMERLEWDDGYEIRSSEFYDNRYACDKDILFRFLDSTQPDEMAALRKIYKTDFETTLINYINAQITQKGGSLLNTLKRGVDISNMHLDLMYTKPATGYNEDLMAKYEKNIFTVMEEVWANKTERIDLVVFLNGFAIMTFELKCNIAGQSYGLAIEKYRTERDPKTRLFLFKAGAFVNFAMDLNEVHMTTKLNGMETEFLPFNMGCGEGVDAGPGNPHSEDKFSVSYMWEDILKKDSVLEFISKFMFYDIKKEKDELTGKERTKESLIFPRYHQLNLIRKLLADVKENKTSQNYLIQHSAGSGKTNEIAWLAHRLASLHDDEDNVIYDSIIIVTDRVVVDRQLQRAVLALDHKSGFIWVMDETCTSAQLKEALEGNTKIIATTIQKFPYIVDSVKALNDRRFAVIIDEAHSSTTGKEMAAVNQALGSGDEEDIDAQDMIVNEIRHSGKQPNVSMFAFTATPKPTTLQLFGRLNTEGQKEAFHIYSMKQAIEEGFILDVLANYTTYRTYYQLNKQVADDPRCKEADAKRQIARFVRLHDTNISQRIEIIVEHFRTTVKNELGGKAKAMVITSSREEAVKYRQALEEYITKKEYGDIHALVAFSGKLKMKGDDTEYTEAKMNGFPEDKLPDRFDADEYNILLVANKYQTGFDQKKLCAMYVLKKLNGVDAVQTLSRLNRVCLPYDKKTFVLDFVNDYDDIINAFKPYYTTTILSNTVTPSLIYDVEAKIDDFNVINPADIEKFNELYYSGGESKKKDNATKEIFYINNGKEEIDKLDENSQREFVSLLRSFVRFYEFILQATSFEDVDLHKKYNYISYLLTYLDVRRSGPGFKLEDKVRAFNFVQKKEEEHEKSDIKPNPDVKIPTAESFGLPEDKVMKLSEVIEELNFRNGKNFDNDIAVKAVLQLTDIMKKSEKLETSAKNNTLDDFSFSYYSSIDDALIEGLSLNTDFFTMLLNNKDEKENILGIFMRDIYEGFRKG